MKRVTMRTEKREEPPLTGDKVAVREITLWGCEMSSVVVCSSQGSCDCSLGFSPNLQFWLQPLTAQLVKSPPAVQETWVRSLGWEDPLEKGKATHSSILAWRIPWTV